MKSLKLFLTAVAALLLTACGDLSKLGSGPEMQTKEAMERIKEVIKENVNKDWKVVGFTAHTDANSSGNPFGNSFSGVTVMMIDPDGKLWTQTFFHKLPSSNLSDVYGVDEEELASFTPIDIDKIDAEAYAKQAEEVIKAIPEKMQFECISNCSYGYYARPNASQITAQMTEKDKRTVSSGGKTSFVYYEVFGNVDKSGKLTIKID